MSAVEPTATAIRNPSIVTMKLPMYGMNPPKNIRIEIGIARGRPSRVIVSHCITAPANDTIAVPTIDP